MIFLLFFLVTQEFEAEIGSEAVIEELQRLEKNPINVNLAPEKDFLKIYWVSPQLAKSIIKTRRKLRGFESLEGLQKVPGMTEEIFEKIQPYITIKPPRKAPPFSFELRSRIQETLPEKEGNYFGNPLKTYERIKLGYRNILGTCLLEKDAYESRWDDFMTGGIKVADLWFFKKIVGGDYRLEFGEDLLFGYPPLITFKTQGMIKGKNRGIKLYTISGENTFLRGVASESQLGLGIKNYIFYSDAKLDARVEDSEVTVYYNYEGDHATESGLEKKDRIRERLWGTRFEFRGPWQAGCTWYTSTHYLNPEGNKIEKHNLFGADFTISLSEINLFGELGRCGRTWAGVSGIEYKSKKIRLGVLSRYYPPQFYVFHSSPFADRSTYTYGISEKGNYVYLTYKISKNTKFTGYTDIITRLSKVGSSDLSVNYAEYLGEVEHKFTKNLTTTGRYRFEKRDVAECRWLRFQTDIDFNDFHLRLRAEKVSETDSSETYSADLLYGDLSFKFIKTLSFTTRLILFNSELHQFRLYEYERDLPGLMTNQYIGGKGSRVYFLLKYSIAPFITFSTKYSVTSKIYEELQQKYGIQLDVEI